MTTGPTATPVFTELHVRRLGPVRRFFARKPGVMDAVIVACFASWALVTGVGADSMYALHAYLGDDQALRMQYATLALTAAGALALV